MISQIETFFSGQTVFLTGGSGFVGKVLIEKLLRECKDLNKIYVLIRAKKDKTPEERFQELFTCACFDQINSTNSTLLKKVCLVNGDCNTPNLGLGDQDRETLVSETTCVIHAAANVKFDQNLKQVASNVKATIDVLNLAKQMPHLRVFVFVSTLFSNCIYSYMKEDFYPPPMESEKLFSLVEALDEETIKSITPIVTSKWPNPYVYGKSIAESVVKKATQDLPITIVRPAIIMVSAKEPMPGWIDNFYGSVGIVVLVSVGILRSLYVIKEAVSLIVPVDYVSNCILAAAWKRESSKTTTIYNYSTDKQNFLKWDKFQKILYDEGTNMGTMKAVWYPCFSIRHNLIIHKLSVFFYQTVQAYIVDGILFCLRKPTIAVKGNRQLLKMTGLIEHFTTKTWVIDDDNVKQLWNEMNEKDKELFYFDMKNIDWVQFMRACLRGSRVHLLKDPLETIAQSSRKFKMLFVLHYASIGIFWFLVFKMVLFVLGLFF